MDEYTGRFGGIARLYGAAGLEKLRAAHVCVVGIGGVGSWTAEALARSGVGKLTLIDLDEVCLTNTNRQIHALGDSVGKAKVQEMAERIRRINPDCAVKTRVEFFADQTAASILKTRYDYLVDAIDGLSNKCLMIAQCRERDIPIITCGAAGGRRDGTAVRVADLNHAKYDKLLFKVRKQLRQKYGFPRGIKKWNLACVYSAEPMMYPQADGTVCEAKAESDGSMKLDCEGGLGAATQVTGAFGFAAAGFVVEELV
jgi:tRNA A37 threonylcarbamoyladenosine dehydratase